MLCDQGCVARDLLEISARHFSFSFFFFFFFFFCSSLVPDSLLRCTSQEMSDIKGFRGIRRYESVSRLAQEELLEGLNL